MLGIVTSYHFMKFQGKLTTQTQEKCEKPHFGSNTGSLDPYSNGQNLASSVTRYHVQYQKKMMIQS